MHTVLPTLARHVFRQPLLASAWVLCGGARPSCWPSGIRSDSLASSTYRLVVPNAPTEPKPWSHVCSQILWEPGPPSEWWRGRVSMGLGVISSGITSEKSWSTLRVKPRHSIGMEAKSHKMDWKSSALDSLLWEPTHLQTIKEFKVACKKARCFSTLVPGEGHQDW